MYKATGGNV